MGKSLENRIKCKYGKEHMECKYWAIQCVYLLETAAYHVRCNIWYVRTHFFTQLLPMKHRALVYCIGFPEIGCGELNKTSLWRADGKKSIDKWARVLHACAWMKDRHRIIGVIALFPFGT